MKQPAALAPLNQPLVKEAVLAALKEDLGLSGDITTNATVDAATRIAAHIVARADGTISGLDVAGAAFSTLDPDVQFVRYHEDGGVVSANTKIATVSGLARGILTAERVALNFLGRMSGIATLTSRYVLKTSGTGASIVDTRKTTPGLRAFEKYAVRCGGGGNHRAGLFDAVLIKDNHIVAAGGLKEAIRRARASAGHTVKLEVEVDTLDQLKEVLNIGADAVLLDNMSPEELRQAVALVDGRALTEASGGVNLDTIASIAATGVDLISVGALTHSAPVLDLGLDFDDVPPANTAS